MLPIVSICIPTYNRKKRLKELLKRIPLLPEVEVCISDNGSTDGTDEYLSKNRKVKSFISNHNSGFDRNVLRVCSMATGKYIWLMGDDDLILPGAVERLVNILKNTENEIIYLQVKETPGIHSQDVVVHPMGFLSSIVFKRSKFLELANRDLDKGIGTNFMHSWILVLIGIKNPGVKATTYPEPILSVRRENYKPILLWDVLWHFGWKRNLYVVTWKEMEDFRFLKLWGFMLRDIFLIWFNILSERKFRSKEKITWSGIVNIFGYSGWFHYVFFQLVRYSPKPLVDFAFDSIVFLITKTGASKRSPDRWERLWTKTKHYIG